MNNRNELPLKRGEMDDDEYTSVCPKCGGWDAFYNIRKTHWVVCNRHMLCWCAGVNQPYFDIGEGDLPPGEEDAKWARNADLLGEYTEVPPGAPRPPKLTPGIAEALNAVLDRLWDDEARDYQAATPEVQAGHFFRHLHALEYWMTGRRPKSTS